MSTDTDWLGPILQLYRRDIERNYGGRTVGKTLNGDEAKAAILQHESQAVKAADKAGRIDELKRIDGYAYGPDYGSYQEIRLKQLQRLEIDPFTDIAVGALEVLLNEAGQYLTPERFDRFLLAALQPYDRLEADRATG